ncbi:uncharacterized protein [Miscanthus floridulus]|uniref:uncharacterized protein n=1 Tax=Miscanthus floridulus TaxID=154761 RepID=UPI003458E0D9
MLLRSASSPLLNCVRAPAAAVVEHLAVVSPLLSPAVAAAPRQGAVLCRAMSEGDLAAPLVPRKDEGHGRALPRLSASSSSSTSISLEEDDSEGQEEDEETVVAVAADVSLPLRRLLTSTGLDVSAAAARETLAALVEQGVGGGSGGGNGKALGSSGGQGGVGDSGDNRAATDTHYRQMIEADPGNSLLLVNYARFLKEVEGDAARAQEYCERAILASPGDAEALSLYAGLVWETSRDAGRADDYYSRAVQAAPDDCYVLGSYAGFLWDAEEDDEENDNSEPLPPPSLFQGAVQHPSITAAS